MISRKVSFSNYKNRFDKDLNLNVDDWKKDGYRWINNGQKYLPNKSKPTIYRLSYKVDTPNGASLDFKKIAYILVEIKDGIATRNDKLIYVQYIGDESIGVSFPHRNNRTTSKPYERTTPSKMALFRTLVSQKDPHLAYKEAVNSNLGPRNTKQFQNLKQKANEKRRLSKEELDGVHLLHFELNIVHQINTVPDVRIASYEIDMISEFNNLLNYSKEKRNMCVFDTTFNLCNYFVSPLCARFTMFESEPVVPIAFFFHERKTEISHQWFFQHLKMVKISCILYINLKYNF